MGDKRLVEVDGELLDRAIGTARDMKRAVEPGKVVEMALVVLADFPIQTYRTTRASGKLLSEVLSSVCPGVSARIEGRKDKIVLVVTDSDGAVVLK